MIYSMPRFPKGINTKRNKAVNYMGVPRESVKILLSQSLMGLINKRARFIARPMQSLDDSAFLTALESSIMSSRSFLRA